MSKTPPASPVVLTPRDWKAHPSYIYPGYKSTVKRGPQKPLVPLKAALGELQQPVYGHDGIGALDHDLTRNARKNGEPLGERMILTGRVLDERRRPVANTLVELWQANAAGRYDHPSDPATAPLDPNFQGYASLKADRDGAWRITTIKPGGYDSPIGHRPPHIHFDIRGRAHRNVAQLYFPEEAAGNAKDMLYKALGADAGTSVALRDTADPNKYIWDIVLMG